MSTTFFQGLPRRPGFENPKLNIIDSPQIAFAWCLHIWHMSIYSNNKKPKNIWRFPESWGYPQSSSISNDGIFPDKTIHLDPFGGTPILGNLYF